VQGINEVVLEKVGRQAEAIVRAAEEEAAAELEKARRRREERAEGERRRRLAAADTEAARVVAQAVMQARNALAAAKAAVMDEIIARARDQIETLAPQPEALARLIAEAVEGLGQAGQAVVGVREDQLELAREIVAGEAGLAEAVREVVGRPIGGGVRVESEDGAIIIDNSHAARLEMLVPRVLARFGRELF
jgi:vacuolar-type H+-ATPase subunit E/Vma4